MSRLSPFDFLYSFQPKNCNTDKTVHILHIELCQNLNGYIQYVSIIVSKKNSEIWQTWQAKLFIPTALLKYLG